jgi:2-oxoglutarate ferredoxin oxidoreductase subunit alpha
MDRLLKKFETAKSIVPEAKIKPAAEPTKDALLFFGTTASPAYEALETLEKEGIHLDTLRLRSFPFTQEVEDFIEEHDRIFVIEQNRDGQMRRLLLNETNVEANAKLISVVEYDGLPVTARKIASVIRGAMGINNVTPLVPKEKELAS